MVTCSHFFTICRQDCFLPTKKFQKKKKKKTRKENQLCMITWSVTPTFNFYQLM